MTKTAKRIRADGALRLMKDAYTSIRLKTLPARWDQAVRYDVDLASTVPPLWTAVTGSYPTDLTPCAAPVQESNPTTPTQHTSPNHEVLAIRYEPQARHGPKKGRGCSWQVWWSDHSVTWQPKKDLTGIDQRYIRDAEREPGKRIKLTGSRREDIETEPLGTAEVLICAPPAAPNGIVSLPFRRDLNQFCALNAVANAMLINNEHLPQSQDLCPWSVFSFGIRDWSGPRSYLPIF